MFLVENSDYSENSDFQNSDSESELTWNVSQLKIFWSHGW